MKIGILTFHRSINNGAFMQCYSLSKKLQQEFPNDVVEVIDYHMPRVDKIAYDTSLRGLLRGSLRKKIRVIAQFPFEVQALRQKRQRKEAFERALKYLPLSSEQFYDDNPAKMFEYIDNNYDVVVAGSDAIWNYNLRGYPNPYFLSRELKAIKMSYAASCYGMNYDNIPQCQIAEIQSILNTYNFIGVRDTESEKMLKFVGGVVNPIHTCDPTFFLDVNALPIDKSSFESKLKQKGFDFNRRTIGIMGNEAMCRMIRKMFGKQYQLVSLYNYNKLCDVNLNDITPIEWAYAFRYFNVTVTTYFHGTLLSLRNGVPVVSIALQTEYSSKHETKVHDVLRRLGLLDCYFETEYKTTNIEPIKSKIKKSIDSDVKALIIERVNNEADTIMPFIEYLRGIHV